MLEGAHPVETTDAVGVPGRAEGQSAEGSSWLSGNLGCPLLHGCPLPSGEQPPTPLHRSDRMRPRGRPKRDASCSVLKQSAAGIRCMTGPCSARFIGPAAEPRGWSCGRSPRGSGRRRSGPGRPRRGGRTVGCRSARSSLAPMFSSSRSVRLVPGMGTIQGCWLSSQASASWAGVAPTSAAMRFRTSTRARFASSASPWNRGVRVAHVGRGERGGGVDGAGEETFAEGL